MKKLIFSALTLCLLGAGCTQKAPLPQMPTDSMPHMNEDMQMGHGMHTQTPGATDQVHLATSTFSSGNITLSFSVNKKDGTELTPDNLTVQHTKKMHLIIVRNDMRNFLHLHPEFVNGKWTVDTNIAESGTYNMYVDVAPINEEPQALRVAFDVTGEKTQDNFPKPNNDNSATDGEYTTTMRMLNDGMGSIIFTLKKGNEFAQDIRPYLGAYGHVVLLKHDNHDLYVHVHPVTETKPQYGEVKFEAQFPEKGRYTAYAQFDIAGNIHTFPITIDVENAIQSIPAAGHSGH